MNNLVEYRANGKLLLTGEYLVLEGACALALPLRYGQFMQVTPIPGKVFQWKSTDPTGLWFEAQYTLPSLEILFASGHETAGVLQRWLRAVRELQPGFLPEDSGLSVSVTADYPLEWGWGSSSTLLAMLAQWSGIDPYTLYRMVSEGSGFDIACAIGNQLLFYQLIDGHPLTHPASAGKALKENTWFCYLGNPVVSSDEVRTFRSAQFSHEDINEISDLSLQICRTHSADELIRLVQQHETIIGRILKRDPICFRYTSFPGTVKSLGAWGGDFAMFVSSADPDEVVTELLSLGFRKSFRYDEISLMS